VKRIQLDAHSIKTKEDVERLAAEAVEGLPLGFDEVLAMVVHPRIVWLLMDPELNCQAFEAAYTNAYRIHQVLGDNNMRLFLEGLKRQGLVREDIPARVLQLVLAAEEGELIRPGSETQEKLQALIDQVEKLLECHARPKGLHGAEKHRPVGWLVRAEGLRDLGGVERSALATAAAVRGAMESVAGKAICVEVVVRASGGCMPVGLSGAGYWAGQWLQGGMRSSHSWLVSPQVWCVIQSEWC
jgi:hypothetical protein